MPVNEDHRRRGRPRCICDRAPIRALVFNATRDARARARLIMFESASERTISLSLSLSVCFLRFLRCLRVRCRLESGEETSVRTLRLHESRGGKREHASEMRVNPRSFMGARRNAVRRAPFYAGSPGNFTTSVSPVYRTRAGRYAYRGIYCNAFSIIRVVLMERKV